MATDPFVAQYQNLFNAQKQADAAQLQAAAQREFINFGGNPNFSNLGLNTQNQPWLAHFTPSVSALAQQNTQAGTSILAQLQKQLADANRVAKDQMAARGILRSGETPYRLSENALQNKIATYNAGQELLDRLSGMYAAVADRERERQFGLLQSQQDAAIRQQELAFRQQQQAQEMALARQQMAMEQQLAAQANAGGGGGDVQGFLDSLFGGGDVGGAPMPSQQEIQAARAVAKKAARHRTPEEKQLIQNFNAQYGPVLSY